MESEHPAPERDGATPERDTPRRVADAVDWLRLGVALVDRETRVEWMNRRAMALLGLAPDDTSDHTLNNLLPTGIFWMFRELIDEALESGLPRSRQLELTTIENKHIPVSMTARPIADAAGDYVMIQLEDRQLEQEVDQLREMDESKNNFIAMVSHELRTPLTSIRGAIYMLESALTEGMNEQQLGMVKLISNNTERLIKEVNNLLDVTYIENKTLTLVRRECELDQLLQTVLVKWRRIAEDRKIELIYDNQEPGLTLKLDLEKVTKVMENLLDNALKFTKEGGKVWVRVDRKDQFCRIRVRDTGAGIPTASRHTVFEKFSQAEQTLTREFGGCGLGLYICRAMVEQHGGRITLLSTSSSGSEFAILLPLEKDDVEEIDAATAIDEIQGKLSEFEAELDLDG